MGATPPVDADVLAEKRAAQRAVLRSYKRWAVGLAAPILYWFSCVPHPATLRAPNGREFQILSVQNEVRWSNTQGKERHLVVALLAHGDPWLHPDSDVAALLPWATRLAEQQRDTLLLVERIAFPYSRFLPYRHWTEQWFQRRATGTWEVAATRR